jgi:PadR family transcriptional regulator AphA
MGKIEGLPPTSFAVLGHIGLRRWSAYELTRSLRRTVHWFWPTAESRIYDQARRLVEFGLARAKTEKVGRRPRTVYSLTPKGRRALASWLGTPAGPWAFYSEPLLRVHLARYGSRDDLLRALDEAEAQAQELLEIGREVAGEFVDGRHLLQEEAHIRGILFDYLWSFGTTMRDWAQRTRTEVEKWNDLEGEGKTERGIQMMKNALRR